MKRLAVIVAILTATSTAYAAPKMDIRGVRLGISLDEAYQHCTRMTTFSDPCEFPDETWMEFYTTSKGRIYTIFYHFTSSDSYESLVESISKEYGSALIEELAKASEKTHPSEALWAYAKRVEQMASLGGNGNYEEACRLIARMARIRKRVGETDAHRAWMTEITARHKAKRNFMKLLRAQAEAG